MSDPRAPMGQAEAPGTTGRMLVLLDERDAPAHVRALSTMGLHVARASEHGPVIPAEVWARHDGVLLDALGVAIVSAPSVKTASVRAAVVAQRGVIAIEPERINYAVGGGIDGDTAAYLRGYRDAVVALVDGLLARDSADSAGEDTPAPELDEVAVTWGLQQTGVASSSLTGRGVKVAILDTGIALDHPDFSGRAIVTESFIPGETVDDHHGHGTHTAGTACGPRSPSRLPRYGVAPDAHLYVGKVLSNAGSGPDSGILAGIDWALRNGCRVISMSLGSRVSDPSPVYQAIGLRALARNAIIVAAAGNESSRGVGTVVPTRRPANCASIMAVAALDPRLGVAAFSNGGKVEIAGPGVGVFSSTKLPAAYRRLNGTSMATPHVAGIAALWMEAAPTATAGEIWDRLKSEARSLPLPPADVGSGLVRAPQVPVPAAVVAGDARTPARPPVEPSSIDMLAKPPHVEPPSLDEQVMIAVDDAYHDKIDEVARALREAGMNVRNVLKEAGTIDGTVPADKRKALKDVTGVLAIETARSVQIAPPTSDVQ